MQLPQTIVKAIGDVHNVIDAGQRRGDLPCPVAGELRLAAIKLVNAYNATLAAQDLLLTRVAKLLKAEMDRRQQVNEFAAKLAEGSEATSELIDILQSEAWRKAGTPSAN